MSSRQPQEYKDASIALIHSLSFRLTRAIANFQAGNKRTIIHNHIDTFVSSSGQIGRQHHWRGKINYQNCANGKLSMATALGASINATASNRRENQFLDFEHLQKSLQLKLLSIYPFTAT